VGSRELTDAGRADAPLALRLATLGDADLLLRWANDPVVRTASLRRDPIERSTHVVWLAARLEDPECRIWIAESGGRPVGVARFQLDDDGRAVVSIAVDAAARGRGIGSELLDSGIAAARADLRPAGFRAWVRTDNAASMALFLAAGFRASDPPAAAAGDAPRELLLEG
jgi:RimJ/RimL family protein N-acetyltransferase